MKVVRGITLLAASILAMASCSMQKTPTNSPAFQSTSFSDWQIDDAAYRFYPGDKMGLNFRSAPELDRELTIAPDGRVSLPLLGSVMVANLSADELRHGLEQAYFRELVDPALTVTPLMFGSQQIFVGGDVRSPGLYPLPGEIDPLQAILMAGGWTDTAKPSHVVLMRRTTGGRILTRVVDVKNGIVDPRKLDVGPLRRFDVVFVTRSRIADENKFIQQFVMNALPIDFSFYYNLKDSRY